MFYITMLHQCIDLLNTLECYESIQAFIALKKMLVLKSNSQVRCCKVHEILPSDLCMLSSFFLRLDETGFRQVVSFVNTH